MPAIHIRDVPLLDNVLTLLGRTHCAGKHVHDANIVATMMAHGIDTLVTMNVDDFKRYAEHVRTIAL